MLFRALRHPNYRLYFGGQSISLIGTWMQNVAMQWLVYQLTRSPFLLGLTGFFGQIPSLILTPIAGVYADRWDRRRLMILTQALAMLQALLLAALVLTDLIKIWHVLALSLLQGISNSVDAPVRQSIVADIVDRKEDLGNAIALNSSMFNGARLIGPAIAGVLLELTSPGTCFLINGFSYLTVIAALALMQIKPRQRPAAQARAWHNLLEGFRYIGRTPAIKALIAILALVSLVGVPYMVLLPIFATDILEGSASTLGLLTSASGAGALCGAIYLAMRPHAQGLERRIPYYSAFFGVSLVVFAFSRWIWLSAAVLVVTGGSMVLQMASTNTVLQAIVDDDKRGRVMSIYMLGFMGVMPIGSLLAGSISNFWGAPVTLAAGGAMVIIGAAVFGIYARRIAFF